MNMRYRIKSYETYGRSGRTLYTVEELEGEGEMRVPARDILSNKKMLLQFNKQDIVRIVYAAASEQATEQFRVYSELEPVPRKREPK